jgi:haloalkane dehalogenase
MSKIERASVEVDGMTLAYLSAGGDIGAGAPVLLLHGWPTSSFLWRNVMPAIAAHRRVIALDLPGFGGSSKPLGASYSFRFFQRALDGFLAALKIDKIALVVHDLGGPVGLYWASQNPERLERLAILNTIGCRSRFATEFRIVA